LPRKSRSGLRNACDGGTYSRQTPHELVDIGDRVGLDGAALDSQPLVAKVDSAAVQDGFQLYLHGCIVTDDGDDGGRKWWIRSQFSSSNKVPTSLPFSKFPAY
jgi:hypothetical protein